MKRLKQTPQLAAAGSLLALLSILAACSPMKVASEYSDNNSDGSTIKVATTPSSFTIPNGPLGGTYANVEALVARANTVGFSHCIRLNGCELLMGNFGPCLGLSAPGYDVSQSPLCAGVPMPAPVPVPPTPTPATPTPAPPVATPTPVPPPATPPPGGYPWPSSCLGFPLNRLDFDNNEFIMGFAPGSAYVTKLQTGSHPGGVYGGRISVAHDNSEFTSLISEKPCDLAEAKSLMAYGTQYISTGYYFVVSDPALNLQAKAKAKNQDKWTVWLKPNTTYYVILINARMDANGNVLWLPEGPGYYYRQGHSNDPTRLNMVPTWIWDLMP